MHISLVILLFALTASLTGCRSTSQESAAHLSKPSPDPKMGCYTDEDFKRVGLPRSAARRILDSRSFWICITDQLWLGKLERNSLPRLLCGIVAAASAVMAVFSNGADVPVRELGSE